MVRPATDYSLANGSDGVDKDKSDSGKSSVSKAVYKTTIFYQIILVVEYIMKLKEVYNF